MSLFGSAAVNASKNLVEFRAGKMHLKVWVYFSYLKNVSSI